MGPYLLAALGAGAAAAYGYGMTELNDLLGLSRQRSFTRPNTITAAAQAYDWANNSMQPIEAWELLKNKPQNFMDKSYWTDRDSYGDNAAQVYYDMTYNDPNRIYELSLDSMKDAVKAFRYGDTTKLINEGFPEFKNNPIFDVNTTDIEQTRKDLLALANMLYAYKTYGTSGQMALANAMVNREKVSKEALAELRDIYASNKDKLAAYDFSGLNLPPDEVPRLLQDLESKKRGKTILNSATSKSDKNSTDSPPIPVDGYSTILQERLQQKRQKGSN